jgi:serine/threonine protein kinase
MTTGLVTDTVISHYRIVSRIGAGAMGVVYRARDIRLNREVAIKLLPSSVVHDKDRLRRFEQEALATSALNHPNILTIFDIGTHNGAQPYIVTELLEGEELRDQLIRGPIAPGKALEYAIQIAAGLSAAHAKSIVHRDLKPENVFVTTDGRVKILDFGLAKLKPAPFEGGVDSKLPTRTPLTTPGTLMGTVAYMSPEQVRGEDTDQRSDIFSFGVVLYEMLTGRKPFTGESSVEVMNAILKEDVAPLRLDEMKFAPALEKIVRRCLEKRPEDRFYSAHDLGFALEAVSATSITSGGILTLATAIAEEKENERSLRRGRFLWIAAAILLMGLLALIPSLISSIRRTDVKGTSVHFTLDAPEKATTLLAPEISPDGQSIVFAALVDGRTSLWLRPLGSLTAQKLPGTEDVNNPHSFSPDSRSIIFTAQGKLKRLELGGGLPRTLCTMPGNGGRGTGGGSSNRQGVTLFTSAGRVYRVASTGGEPELVLGAEQSYLDVYYRWPYFLPDGNHFLFLKTFVQQGSGSSEIYVGSLAGKQATRLFAADSHAIYTPAGGGYLLFARDGALFTQSFDAEGLKLSGDPVAIADKVTVTGDGRGYFSVSETGNLILDPSGTFDVQQLTWVDRAGKAVATFGEKGALAVPFGSQRRSPDGKRVAVARGDPKKGSRDIYVMDITRGTSSRLTFDPGDDLYPVWSPDGSRIAWASNREGVFSIYQKLASGLGNDELLLKMDDPVRPDSWSPDGRFIMFDRTASATKGDIWVLPLYGDRKTFPFLQTPFNEGTGRLSPDGHFIAYVSDDQGRNEVYVQTFPASGDKWQISNNGGSAASWRPDGRELFYVSADHKVMSVEIKTTGTFEAGVPTVLFDFASLSATGDGGTSYAVSLDGQRFLVSRQVERPASLQYAVVVNWIAELSR